MNRVVFKPIVILCCCLLIASLAHAQGGGTSTISGTVVDSDGGVIPGATVVVKDVGTGTTYTDVTNGQGAFSVPALVAGTYTVTVSLQGFKTAVVENVRVAPGTPATVQAVLTIGALQETVTVTSSSELINTQTATVSSTLNVDQLNRMPTPTRNALNAVTFLPGVNTATCGWWACRRKSSRRCTATTSASIPPTVCRRRTSCRTTSS